MRVGDGSAASERSYRNAKRNTQEPYFRVSTGQAQLKTEPHPADTRTGLVQKIRLPTERANAIQEDIRRHAFWARWVRLWTPHNECRPVRAKPEITRRTGFGGPDETAARALDERHSQTPTGPLHERLPWDSCIRPDTRQPKGGERTTILSLLRRERHFWIPPWRTERATRRRRPV